MPEDAVLRLPNDITQQAICTLQDTLQTIVSVRQSPPHPPVQLEGEVNSFLR